MKIITLILLATCGLLLLRKKQLSAKLKQSYTARLLVKIGTMDIVFSCCLLGTIVFFLIWLNQ